jgi:2-polyprenyl-3-methyl-5-hydroxy-6-metoxy-1,4-benzoquinol methylase
MQSIYESSVDPLRPNDAHGISLQLVGQYKSVLELGAASGHVTRALKSLNNTVTAIERDGRFEPILTTIADHVVITDLDWLDLRQKLPSQKFDVVLAGDVLEHCQRPELVLLQLHDLLADEGYVVISLPNIAHADVRLALLTGKFEYRPTGLLDQTHLRFFTRDTITSFLIQNDFEVAEVFASTAALGTTEFGAPSPHIPQEAIAFVQEDRDSQVYQYILRAIPRSDRANTVNEQLSNEIQMHDNLLAKLSLYEEYVGQMTSHANALIQEELEAVKSELEAVKSELEAAKNETRAAKNELQATTAEIYEQKVKVLEARDHAIGASAELGVIRYRYLESQKQADSLLHQLNILHGSRTWRIGRFMLLPLRALRKLIRIVSR